MLKKNILLFLTFLSTIYLFPQSELNTHSNYKVNYFTIEEGLSNNKVNAICKDRYGFIWFGTNEGLNRYDGYNIISYQNDKSDTLSISNNLIRAILEDRDGLLWIGTDAGLNLYDPDINGFQRVPIGDKHHDMNFVWQLFEDKNGILWIATQHGLYYKENGSTKIVAFNEINKLAKNPRVVSVYLDSRNNLWAGTRENGLLFYSFKSVKSKQFINVPDDSTTIAGNWIKVIYEDKKGDLWIGASKDGLCRYNYEKVSFSRIPVDLELSNNETIRDIIEDKYGQLWIGTQSGLYLKKSDTYGFTCFAHTNNKHTNLNHNSIYDIFIDDIDIIWLATYAGGVNYIDMNQKKFNHYYSKANNDYSLNSNSISSIYEDSRNNLWIGTGDGGVNYYNRSTETFEYILNDPENTNSLSGNNVKAIIEDKSGNFWIGTYKHGLNYYNVKTKTFKHYRANDHTPLSLGNDNVYDLMLDSEDNLWIATEKGLDLWPARNNEIIHLGSKGRETSIFEGDIASTVFEDSHKNIWVGTYFHGLLLFNRRDSSLGVFKGDDINGIVYSISEDDKNNLWIGGSNGLYYLNLQKDSVINYTEKDGLPVRRVFKAFDDKAGNVWVSTTAGLAKFINGVNTPHIPNFKNYDTDDGLQSKQFVYNSNDKSRSGEIYFGGINGFNSFHPSQIVDNPYKPSVVITGLKVFNNDVAIGQEVEGRIVLKKHIANTEELVLSYKHYVFTLEFAALHFAQANKNKYAYRLEGFDPMNAEWNYTSAENRNATYTNLNGGEYIFKVKASNNDGVWNENPTILKIKILPPFWKTTWFITLVIFIILLSATSIYYMRINSLKNQKQILEQTVNERTEDLKNSNADLQQQKDTISKLSEFGQKVTAIMNLMSINNMIFDFVSSLMDTTNFGISVYNSDTKSLFFPAMIEDGKTLPQFQSMLTEKSSGAVWCFLNQKVIFSNDFHSEYKKYIGNLNIRTSKTPCSLIYIPLIVEKKKIGVLTVQSNRKNAYTQHDYVIIQTLASYVAIALDNANVYKLLEEKNIQLEQQTISLNKTNTLLEERRQTIEKQAHKLMKQKEELIYNNINLKELNSTKDKFFSIIAHDIKNPFQSVLGFSEILHRRFDVLVDEKRKKFVKAIFDSSESIYKLLENLLEWSRAQTKNIRFSPTHFFFKDVIHDNLRILQENIMNKRIKFLFENTEEIEVYADRKMISTVFRNILSNAIKFTGMDGEISLSFSKNNDDLVICIKDTGLGIDQEDIDKLFKIDQNFIRGGTNGEKGTGLGLLICKEFIDNHSGKIWVESVLGKGSAFFFTIPNSK